MYIMYNEYSQIMKKKRDELNDLIDEQNKLDSILSKMSQETNISSKELNDLILPKGPQHYMNFTQIQKESEEEAKEIVNSWLNHYLSDDVRILPYVSYKQKVDVLMLSKLLSYIKRSEYATTKLMEQIDDGNFHPRNFEVLAAMEKSQMEIIKHYIQASAVMENTYRDTQTEYESKHINEEDETDNTSPYGMIGMAQSHKALLQQLENEDNELAEYEIEDEGDVTDE